MVRAGEPSDAPNAGPNKFNLSCDECSLFFSHPSHLDSHRLTHAHVPSAPRFVCPRCDLGFAQHEALVHHMFSAHNHSPRKKKAGRKSCTNCNEKKLRCDRTVPCASCSEHGTLCEYNPAMERGRRGSQRSVGTRDAGGEVHATPASSNASPSYHTWSAMDGRLEEEGGGEAEEETRRTSGAERPLLPQAHGHVSELSPQSSDLYSSQAQPSRSPVSTATANITSSSITVWTPQLSDGTQTSAAAGYDVSHNLDHDGLLPTQFSRQADFSPNGFDWLDLDMPDSIMGNQDKSRNQHAPPPSARAEEMNSPNIAKQGPGLQTAELQHQQTPAQPRPLDRTLDSPPHRYTLPPLREVLETTSRPEDPSARNPRLDNLIELLSGPRLPHFSALHGVGAVEAFGNLQHLLDLYFAHFHDVQAIIHRPTWDRASAPTVLLAAMACVGALMSDNPADVQLLNVLSGLCMPMIGWMGATDGHNYRDISYLNALCLHQIYSLGSGNRQLYHNADRSRGTLIGALRGMRLLSASRTPVSGGEPHSTVDGAWRTWIAREQERRAAWAAFEYDCSICTLTGRRGAVDLGELPQQLPCLETLWEAASATAWYALRSRLPSSSYSPSLSEVLKTASSTNQDHGLVLGSWAKQLCAQVVGRLLWDLKQLEVVTVPQHLGLLSSLPDAHRQSKEEMLGLMRSLFGLTTSPSSTSDLVTHNITGLLCHYSHLYAAGDVINLVVYLVRGTLSPDNPPTRDLGVARRKLQFALAQNVVAGRTLVWHAAQILAIANEYLVSTPCEIMRIFMAYVFIMAYSVYGPKADRDPFAVPVRLDLSDQRPHHGQAVGDWMRHGGPARVGSVADIFSDGCFPSLCNNAQAMMQKLRCWGLAEKFTKILQTIGEKGL